MPKAATGDSTMVKAKASGLLGKLLMVAGLGAIIVGGMLSLLQKTPPPKPAPSAAAPSPGPSGFVGHSGYVIKLPPGYTAIRHFRDEKQTVEVVYFCKVGTDPTNFIDEGLFGQLGIVKLVVGPSPVPNDLDGINNLSEFLSERARQRGETFTMKQFQLSNLHGVQLDYQAPFPRIEAFLLGHSLLYSFTAGQDDAVFRSLLQSLRDSRSEI
ncbi:MAG: hypothetical protein KGO96_00540 [Elusimicrobia bacterium]|nr:hypothetical protein [Elusimicrobiota bacterium]MDE2424381.1 hypothetical protein [Elusimicrobiota bacterium]